MTPPRMCPPDDGRKLSLHDGRRHCMRSYKQERTAVTQALEAAVIERVGSELDSEPDLTICWVCFILPKPMNMSTVK